LLAVIEQYMREKRMVWKNADRLNPQKTKRKPPRNTRQNVALLNRAIWPIYQIESLELRLFLSATQLAFANQPGNGIVNQAINPALQVAVEDASGNIVTTDNSTVTMTFASGPVGASLGGTLTAQAVNGIATFNNLSTQTLGTYQLECFDGTLASAVSSPFTVTGAPFKLIFTTEPSNTYVGDYSSITSLNPDIPPTVTVEDVDQYGNVVLSDNSNLTLSFGSAPSGATPGQTFSATFVNGIATVSDLWFSYPGNYTLVASNGVAAPATSTPFAVLGNYSLKPVTNFVDGGNDFSLNPVLDAQGDLFWVYNGDGGTGYAWIYELPAGSNSIVTIASFESTPTTISHLTIDGNGNLYGLADASVGFNSLSSLSIFEIQKSSNSVNTLFSVQGFTNSTTFEYPYGNIVVDGNGNLYFDTTTTTSGDSQIAELAKGSTTITTLHTFTGSLSNLAMDETGNLFAFNTPNNSTENFIELIHGSNTTKTLSIFPTNSATAEPEPSFNFSSDASGDVFDTFPYVGNGNITKVELWEYSQSLNSWEKLANGPYSLQSPFVGSNGQVLDSNGIGALLEAPAVSVSTVTPTASAKTIAAFYSGTQGYAVDSDGTIYTDGYLVGLNMYQDLLWELTPLPATPANLVFTQQPAPTTAGAQINSVAITAENQNGAVMTSDNSIVTISVASGPGSVLGTLTAQMQNGVATFSNLSIQTAGTHQLEASDAADSPAISNSFTISPAAAAGLQFVQQIANATANSLLSLNTPVQLVDQYGNPIGSDFPTYSLNTIEGTGTLTSSSSPQGTLEFSVNQPGIYSIEATDGSLTPAMSNTFQVFPSTYTFTVPVSFNSTDGSQPQSGLVMDESGNLFGTTTTGGTYGDGTIFEIPAGTNSVTTLASFNGDSPPPPFSDTLLDENGNLFGTTYYDGAFNAGSIFELPAGSNSITTLASFNGNGPESYPTGNIVMDSSGNIFGMGQTQDGNNAEVYELAAGSNSITPLAEILNAPSPNPGLTMDAKGDIYGATGDEDAAESTVFEIAKGSNTVTTLVSATNYFEEQQAFQPNGLLVDSQGNIFGTSGEGGSDGESGYVFEITAGSNSITNLASFNSVDGYQPLGPLIMDGDGNLYGTTSYGGASGGGTVFELVKGTSQIITLTNFIGTNGEAPMSELTLDSHGNLFGTTPSGGANGDGEVFELQAPHLAFLQPPTNSAAGTALNPAVSVALEDPNGNIITGDDSMAAITSNPGTIDGTAVINANNGIFTFTGLSISPSGSNTLTVTDISYTANPLTSNPFTVFSTVSGRYVFYNDSTFNGYSNGGTTADLNAIAPDKTALLPGQTATYSNLTDYSKGINGIIIDISNLPNGATLTPSDFQFAIGDVNDTTTWTPLATSPTVTLLPASGGITPVDLTWPNGTITNTWLQVTVLADANTGLASNDVSYYGNLIGKVSDTGSPEQVTALDLTQIENNIVGVAAITDPYDVNKDGSVDAEDLVLTQRNSFSALRLITPTGDGPAAVVAATPQIVAAMSSSNSNSNLLAPLTMDSSTSNVTDLLGRPRRKTLHAHLQ
jgi:uncharacterized repeat protein (TIGR03803 family)